MRLYLAGRYSRRLELCEYRSELTERGFTVVGPWLDGLHRLDDAAASWRLADLSSAEQVQAYRQALRFGLSERAMMTELRVSSRNLRRLRHLVEDVEVARTAELHAKFALDDIDSILGADALIAFTDRPGATKRDQEVGVALGADLPVTIIGPRQGAVLYWLPEVAHYETWVEFLDTLNAALAEVSPDGPEAK